MKKITLIILTSCFLSLGFGDNHYPNTATMEALQCKFTQGNDIDDAKRVFDSGFEKISLDYSKGDLSQLASGGKVGKISKGDLSPVDKNASKSITPKISGPVIEKLVEELDESMTGYMIIRRDTDVSVIVPPFPFSMDAIIEGDDTIMLEDMFEMEVHNINPMTARKNVFGKARVKGIKAKDLVKMKIEEMYNTKKWCKETTRGNWDKRNIDMYDGLVMSLFEEKA